MMDVEKGKGEKEKSNMMATKEEPMETEPIKEKTPTEEAGGKSAKTVIKDASRETAAGGLPAYVKQEPGASEDNDPVIHEIPVYLSKSIPKLYLFQYPVRPAILPYDNVEVSRARVKPINKQVELELRMDTASPNYSRSKGEQIALNVDGPPSVREERTRAFQSNVMDKQTLVGSSAVEKTGRYAVGILNDNELHLTQVEGVVSLRPSLGYLDKSDLRSKTSAANSDPDAEAPDVKPEAVTVKFARGDPEKNKKYKERSFEYQQKLQDEEAWVEADFNRMSSPTWDAESQKMFCGAMDNMVAPMEKSPDDYLLSLKDGQGS